MDLPTCPHCGESVLDDDVEDCPFCGESMSAKPTGKKKPAPKPQEAPAPVASAKAESKPQAKPAAQKPTKRPAESAPREDEPFAVDQAALSNAVPLRPKPTKGRTYKVICPMCETPGYTSPKAGGREVKCANPKCLVPIFTCPEPPPAPVEEPEPEPAGLSTTQLGLISVVLLAAVGAGIWFFVLKEEEDPNIPQKPAGNVAGTENVNPNPDSDKQQVEQPKDDTPPQPRGPNLVKLRQDAPPLMIQMSNLVGGRTPVRSKPLAVQYIALAYADLGELQKAEEQLDRLSAFNDDSPHYRVLPWVEIGWKRREREESAADAATKALEFAQDIPPSNHDSWLEVVSLSGLLAALGRADEALPLFERNLGRTEDQELWGDLMAVSLDHTFNLEGLEPVRPLVTPRDPAWSAVVWQLVFHKAAAEGLDWAKRANAPPIRSEALIAWADASVALALAEKQPADLAALDAAIQELSKPWSDITAARSYARMGQRYAVAGDQAAAEPLLKKAETALAAFPPKEPMSEPDLKAIYEGRFPNTPYNEQMAAAAFEVARLQARLNQNEAAWNSVEQGLAVLRSESLPESIASRLAAAAKSDANFLRSQLQTALSLESEDKARTAFRSYLKNVNDLNEAAKARLNLQATLLSQAAGWGLAENVYQEITEEPADGVPDSYFSTDLPWALLAELSEKNSELARNLQTTLRQRRVSKPKALSQLEDTAREMEKLNIPKVASSLTQPPFSLADSVRKRWIIRLCNQQILKGHTEEMLSFLLSVYSADPFLGEDAAHVVAGFATQQGQGDVIWSELGSRTWPPTQKIAAYHGFIEAATPVTAEPEPQPEMK